MTHRSFEDAVLPHLDAAFNYARWLAKNDPEAEDVVQDACVRALRFFSSLRGENPRAWLLSIVRNTWYGRAAVRSTNSSRLASDEAVTEHATPDLDPQALAIQREDVERVREALETLPTDFREVLVLRELEGLSYKEIAAVAGVPIGTVMSRLARGRERLLAALKSAPSSTGEIRALP